MDRYKITINTYNRVAEAYREKFMQLDVYDDTYDRFSELLSKKDAKILELGCGPGNIANYLRSRHSGYNILATDAAPNMITLARRAVPGVEFRTMDCRDINLLQEKFDGIICGFVILYLNKKDAAQLIHDAAGQLHENGLLYLSFIEDDYSASGFETGSSGDGMYVYYYDEPYMQEQLLQNGFMQIETFRKPYIKSNGKESVHLIMLARKVH